ncbi:aldo/keto reductase [Kineosporia babensis]|uniref:Aldo/keto reductase n=1 Tax=Kineosporia babensis TaxID=499548 RepID=A0A9X1T464_9ACTN|nr:aldo/keto reductase [Kineosporia babensis]MCD5316438.1 aldo/keto reductase [Kineosporia babensis]
MAVEYRTLGRTGVQVAPLALGAMNFTVRGEDSVQEPVRIIHQALERGINLIDTADVYGQGGSEEVVGRALKGRRDSVVLATKAGLPMGEAPQRSGSSRRWLVQAVEESLRRLGTDWIDLYQVHRFDPQTAHEETLAALTDLQHAGKIRYFGTSNYQAYRLVEAQHAAHDRGLSGFVSEQANYSLLMRGLERDVLPVAQQYGLGTLIWGPLSGGWLSGAVRAGQPIDTNRARHFPAWFDLDVPVNQRRLDVVEQLAGVAAGAGLTLIELALGFVTAHPGVTAAIIGPRTREHLEAQLAALELRLPDDVLDAVDMIVGPGSDLAPGERYDLPSDLQNPRLRRRP